MNYFLIIVFIVAGIYYLFLEACILFWIKEPEYQAAATPPSTRISIIIAARNEEKNIGECLKHLMLQEFPSSLYEIIVVDDDSSDNTAKEVQRFIIDSDKIRLLQLKGNSSKKKAIEEGIKNSRTDVIITVDADCTMNKYWLGNMVSCYEQRKSKMLIGPVVIKTNSSNSLPFGEGWGGAFQSVEYAGLMLTAGASAFMKRPLMCSGTNLLYEKTAFNEVNGFEGIDHKASGDDVLLMFKMQKKFPRQIHFIKSKEAIVQTKPVATLNEFIQQRIRWASKTSGSGNWLNISMALSVFLFNLILISWPVISIINPAYFSIGLNLLVAKCLIDFLFLFLSGTYFNKRHLLILFPFFLLFNIIYVPVIAIAGIFIKQYHWKGRLVN